MNKLLTLIGTTLVILAVSGSASAHVKLTETMPVDGAQLSVAPKMAMLHFNKPTRVVRVSLKQGDKPIPFKFKPSKKLLKMLHVSLPTLSAGDYQLSWILLGNDGHKMKDSISFSVK